MPGWSRWPVRARRTAVSRSSSCCRSSFRRIPWPDDRGRRPKTFRFLGADSAIEEGAATITNPRYPSDLAVLARLTAHSVCLRQARRGMGWDSVVIIRPQNQSPRAHRLMNTSRNWRADRSWVFMKSNEARGAHHLSLVGKPDDSCCDRFRSPDLWGSGRVSGSQRIGSDPRLKQIRYLGLRLRRRFSESSGRVTASAG